MLVDVRQLLTLEVAEELVQRDVWWIIHLWVEHRDVKHPSQETSEYCNNTNWKNMFKTNLFSCYMLYIFALEENSVAKCNSWFYERVIELTSQQNKRQEPNTVDFSIGERTQANLGEGKD